MSDKAESRATPAALAVAVGVAGLIAGYVLQACTAGESPNGGSGFQERAQDAGIAFRMNYLPKEQGERFRMNLYDHGSGLAVGDYDNDGREDIYFLDQRGQNALQTRSNRDAIGAVVRVWLGKTVMVRQVNPAGGYLSHSSRVVHFGLGDRSKVDRVEIRWPRGIVQTLDNPEINALHKIREPTQ